MHDLIRACISQSLASKFHFWIRESLQRKSGTVASKLTKIIYYPQLKFSHRLNAITFMFILLSQFIWIKIFAYTYRRSRKKCFLLTWARFLAYWWNLHRASHISANIPFRSLSFLYWKWQKYVYSWKFYHTTKRQPVFSIETLRYYTGVELVV